MRYDISPSVGGAFLAVTAVVDPKPSDYRDTSLCAAYLSPSVMHQGGVQMDDVVRVTTQRSRSAVVRIIGEVADPGETIRFDRFTRQALKAFPHEKVTIERIEIGAAEEVVLIPAVDMSTLHYPQLVPHLKRVLAGNRTPVRAGMLLYLKLPDALAGITYDVHFVSGEEGVVSDATHLYLEIEEDHHHDPGSDHQHLHDRKAETVVDTTYEDVGGLSDQIRAVREFVELPLVFPQVYRQLGISPPRGVIFYGAPGTGKTLLARSVANEINARFFYINGPEIVGTFSGQTEENLRKVFADAAINPPSIIFVDELDAIAPVRGTTSTLSDTRAVTQLLALMDGLKRAEGVMVIGTTNRIEAVDRALRRAGRFDREVFFPTPSASGRLEILRVHTREMPLSQDALDVMPKIAEAAYGFVGADLMELCREAGLNALRRASQDFLENPSITSYPSSDDLVVTADDLQSAVGRVSPASLRESLISYPDVTWGAIGGLAKVKKRLRDLIERPLRHPDLFIRLGLPTNPGILLHGPPGGGKTMLAQAVARECGVNFVAIQGPELLSQWLGESEESVRGLFNVARRAAPCVIFFDQLDAIAPRRTEMEFEGTRAPQRVVSQLLSELDGMEQRTQVMVIGATNNIGVVDPSVLRPGRFGVHIYVGLPDEADRAEILAIQLRSAALAPDVALDGLIAHLAALTAGYSGADLAFLCQGAKHRALEEADYSGEPGLAERHFKPVLEELGAQVSSPERDAQPLPG
jgi:transitional endoplasmic reticulum ATPase